MNGLNSILKAEKGLETKPCNEFGLTELHAVQRVLFEARAPDFNEVYAKVSDTRGIKHRTTTDLEKEQAAVQGLVKSNPDMFNMVRDGVCHETVMWYVHHLSEGTKHEVQQLVVLPLLPEMYHSKPTFATPAVKEGHARYTNQVSCAICHVDTP